MFNTVPVRPRFSVVIPVRDRADVIGRAVAGVLAQTFANHEVLVVDRGSVDPTREAVRAVADHRVRVLERPGADVASACTQGVDAARGRWVVVLDPDDEVAPGWLARLGRLIDATDAELVSCGGDQVHADGSMSRILPEAVTAEGATVRVCFRSGAFVATRRSLVRIGAFGGPDEPRRPDEVGELLLLTALTSGHAVAHTPEPLVRWNEPDDAADSTALPLRWSLQGLDALARTPIPDGELLTRYAIAGGVAAARLDDWAEARRLFRLARRLQPNELRHWARWLLACVPPVAARVWGDDVPLAETPAIAG